MILNQAHKTTPRWPTLIKQERKRLKMTQAEFGAHFGVSSATAVSLWESGDREAPYIVTWYIYKRLTRRAKK